MDITDLYMGITDVYVGITDKYIGIPDLYLTCTCLDIFEDAWIWICMC